MAYEFTKLSDVEVVETPMDTANVLIEEDGIIKKAPKTAVGGSSNIDLLISCNTESLNFNGSNYTVNKEDIKAARNKMLNGEPVNIVLKHIYVYSGITFYKFANCSKYFTQNNEPEINCAFDYAIIDVNENAGVMSAIEQ